jgi:hypothetical protein
MSAFETGPFVAAAFFCEKVLTEGDGTHTYVRVIDRMSVEAVGPAERAAELEEGLAKIQNDLVLVVTLRAGRALGSFQVAVVAERPSGQRVQTPANMDVHFPPGEDGGVNIHLNFFVSGEEEGLHWFDILGGPDQRLMTRVPLRIQVSRFRTP